MNCKFCKEEKKLVKAHIVPEAFFRELWSGEKSPVLVDDSPNTYPKKSPIGVYDKNLVCNDCETLFSDWDGYGQLFILDIDSRERLEKNGSVIADIVKDFDYDKLKLFFISILWRASASTSDFYSKINLGPYEEKCKKMIMDKNSGDENEFSVNIARYPDPAGKVIVEPHPERWDGINYCRFYLAGHIATIKVDKRKSVNHMKGLMLKRDKPLFIPHKDIYKSIEAELMLKVMNKVSF